MPTKQYRYKDKGRIFAIFNLARSSFEEYERLCKGNNTEQASEKLDIAGNNLQKSYELGLKCYLYTRYKELYNNGSFSYTQCEDYIHVLDDEAKNIKYLLAQMRLYASPAMNTTGIDFNLIRVNAQWINNNNKHVGDEVREQEYRESFTEIRKFILTYLDKNAPIQSPQISEYLNLQEECDFWKGDSFYNYCLICDKSELDDSEKRRLLYINWAMIIDFDTMTNEDGLFTAYCNEYGRQPNIFNISNPKSTVFNSASTVPYWFHINGVQDMPESLAGDNYRLWNQKYGLCLSDCFTAYHKAFSKPLIIIIMSGDCQKVKDIIKALDAVYDGGIGVFLLSQEIQYEEFSNFTDSCGIKLKRFPLTERDFSKGINDYRESIFNKEEVNKGVYVSGRDGKVSIDLTDYSCFEIPYLGVEEKDTSDDCQDCESFYIGKRPISWYGVQNNFAINRIKIYRDIKNKIVKHSGETKYSVEELIHDPGAGGTTLSRLIAYELSKEMPVMLLDSYNDKLSYLQVENFYRQVSMSVLIVIESAVVNKDDLKKFIGELMSHGIPHVILYVCRRTKSMKSTDEDLRYLTDLEYNEMVEKLTPYINNNKKDTIKNSISTKDRYPFILSMYAFDDKFAGIPEYISHFMVDISDNDKKTLEYISLVDQYANKAIDVNFFGGNSLESVQLFEDNSNDNLVTFTNKGKNTFVKMRFPRFSEEIISRRINNNKSSNSMAKAEAFSGLLREFIRDSKKNIMIDLDSTIDVLKNLLILRDRHAMYDSRFSPAIEKIKELIPGGISENEKYTCIGLVFKELVELYNNEPHFRAHLSRYYTHIENNYKRGIEEARNAVLLADGTDPLLFHIYGMSVREFVVRKLFKQAKQHRGYGEEKEFNEIISLIIENLEIASEQFRKVRDSNNKEAGYISDIEMCISVIDFGKEIFDCSTEEFFAKHKDSWMMEYYDRALMLFDGFRAIQIEEDTEYLKVKLKTQLIDSIQDIVNNIGNTLDLWQDYLKRANDVQKPRVRRFIAKAKENSANVLSDKEAKAIMNLMEENMKQEPENGANIRIWFNALRYIKSDNSESLLDEASRKLSEWKRIGNNLEAYYYHFIVTCIRAIEGNSRAEASIPSLQEELKNKSAHMPNNRTIYEWLGEGKGIGRLISTYRKDKGKFIKKSLDDIEKEACRMEGRISKYKSDRNAQIKAYNMEIFFLPNMQNKQATEADLHKKVSFVLGFSYDGLRALSRSVQISDGKAEPEVKDMRGREVKCTVIGVDSGNNFLKVRLSDYRGLRGSIHKSKMKDGENILDYKQNDVIYGRIIGEKLDGGRQMYDITRREEEDMEDWQKALKQYKK